MCRYGVFTSRAAGQQSAQIEAMKSDAHTRASRRASSHENNDNVHHQESVFGDDCWIAERLRVITSQAQEAASESEGCEGSPAN